MFDGVFGVFHVFSPNPGNDNRMTQERECFINFDRIGTL